MSLRPNDQEEILDILNNNMNLAKVILNQFLILTFRSFITNS